jgi:hypothetical protein
MSLKEPINVSALLAERKIREAMREGQFDNLPGFGRPQSLEDLSHLPPELRLAYIILKNSGYLEEGGPEAPSLRELLRRGAGEARDGAKVERLNFLLNRARRRQAEKTGAAAPPESDEAALEKIDPDYLDKLLKRF